MKDDVYESIEEIWPDFSNLEEDYLWNEDDTTKNKTKSLK